MRVLAVQLDIAWEDKPANHRRVRELLGRAGVRGGELVVLPEMFSTGFSMNVPAVSDTWSGEDRAFLERLAKELGVWVIAGVVSTGSEGKGRNHAVVVGPAGAEVARYTKVHPFAPGKEAMHYVGGDDVLVTDIEGVRVCPFVCYDLRFPEAFRHTLRDPAGPAELFTVIANWPDPKGDYWVALLRARAIENQAYVLGVNRCGRDPWLYYPGRTVLFSPKGDTVLELGPEEGVLAADVDPAVVRGWREEFPVLRDVRDIWWR